jgi:DNA-binding IclR family transcriptional regulator
MIIAVIDRSPSVISRAFRVLEAFHSEHTELTLEDLARRTGLPRSTVHRLACQLVEVGALERTPRGWQVGVTLFELGQLVPTQRRLRELALPFMGDLYEATHQTIQLAVLDGHEVVYVEVLAGHRRVHTPSRRGGRMPAHCTALGKAMLAYGGVELTPPLEARTKHTITELVALNAALRDIRRVGVAYDREEAAPGLVCVAAPIFARTGSPVAALSVSMPAHGRLVPEQVTPAVRIAALALSRVLSGRTTGAAPGAATLSLERHQRRALQAPPDSAGTSR